MKKDKEKAIQMDRNNARQTAIKQGRKEMKKQGK